MDTETIDQRLSKIETFLFSQKNVYNLNDLTTLTGLSKSHLYKLTCSGRIPFYKQGKYLYFDRQEIESWLKMHPVKTMEEIEQESSTFVTLHKL
jgi:excisionase family DNA binding protein